MLMKPIANAMRLIRGGIKNVLALFGLEIEQLGCPSVLVEQGIDLAYQLPRIV